MKKIVISLMIIVMVVGLIYTKSTAVIELGLINVYPKAVCERLLTYHGSSISTTYVAYMVNGVEYPAYCLDVDSPGAGEIGEYTVTGGSKLTNEAVWRVLINGYPYKTIEELGVENGQEAFTATKQAVYTVLYGRNTADYGAVDSDAGRRTYAAYCNIVNAAMSSTESLVGEVQVAISPISNEWEVDSIETSYISREFCISSNVSSGNAKISLSGNTTANMKIYDMSYSEKDTFSIGEHFKVMVPITELTESGSFNIDAIAQLESKPVVYGTAADGMQDYALTGIMYEEAGSTLSVEYDKNQTKIVVYKLKLGTTDALEGVKFELLNEQEEAIYEELITDEDGTVIIDNLLPGTYYLREIETLEGYELNDEVIEIVVEYGETKEVTVNNEETPEPEPEPEPEVPEEPTPEIPETPVEEIKVLPKTGI